MATSWQRLLIAFMLLLCIGLAMPVKAQDPATAKVKIKAVDLPLADILKTLEQQTHFVFSYSEQIVEDKTPISISAEGDLQSFLKELMTQCPYHFKQVDRTIYVIPRKKTDPAPAEDNPDHTVRGCVLDAETATALPGATVYLKGMGSGVITDADGRFTITAPHATGTLVMTFIGYHLQEVPVNGRSYIAVSLTPSTETLREVVVIGYGEQQAKYVTTSIASVTAADLQDRPVSSFDQALAGKAAGVQILQTTGTPGGNVSIRVRGTSSVAAGNNPLIVIDGVPISDRINQAGQEVSDYDTPINPLTAINPNDIETIDILKDAAAAAIYGSRGNSGVILITTKKGKKGEPTVTYDAYVGLQEVSKKIDLMNAYQFAALSKDAHDAAYLDVYPNASADDPNVIRGGSNAFQVPNELYPYLNDIPGLTDTDWQDEIFVQAPMQSHNLAIAGGSDNVTYYVAANYFDQEGIVRSSGYERYSARLNLNVDGKKLDAGVTFNPSYAVHDRVNAEGPYWDEGVVASALGYAPIFPVYNADRSFNYEQNDWCCQQVNQLNPVALAELPQNELDHTSVLGNIYLQYNLWNNLYYKVSAGGHINHYKMDYFRPSILPKFNEGSQPTLPQGISRTTQFVNWLVEHMLRYERSQGKHYVQFMAGFSAQKETREKNWIEGTLADDRIQTLNRLNEALQNGGLTAGGSNFREWSLRSYLGRVQYEYQGKYLFAATLRADGHSRFAPNNKYGVFPSASAGWILSEEPFFQVPAVEYLKVRASYGLTGNADIPDYAFYPQIGKSNYVSGPDDGSTQPGAALSNARNNDLRWEKTKTFDAGIEATGWHKKLGVQLDYYVSNTDDLLLDVPTSALTGFQQALQNIGAVRNEGVEVTLSSEGNRGALHWQVSANLATNTNRVTAVGPEGTPIIKTGGYGSAYFITRVGSPIGAYYTLKEDGVFTSEEALAQYPHFDGAQPGDFKFLDINKNDTLDIDGDRTITGSFLPAYTFGINTALRYKGLDLAIDVQGAQGYEIMNLLSRYIYNLEGSFNSRVEAVDRWRSPTEPGTGQINRANRKRTGNNGVISSWHIEDGSYVRVRNITLGYSLPTLLIHTWGIQRFRVYVNVQNAFTFTGYSGYNPEINARPDDALTAGEDYGTYPVARTFTTGINLTF